jgi:hypothetical protein
MRGITGWRVFWRERGRRKRSKREVAADREYELSHTKKAFNTLLDQPTGIHYTHT